MYRFNDDYSEGAHPEVLQQLTNTNLQQHPGYGEDVLCTQAKELLLSAIQDPHAQVHFVSGGTQANIISLASTLKPYECVIAAQTGHINGHEAGAIEATGHKIETIETPDGKLTPLLIQQVTKHHVDHHTVKPKVVYISNTTEVGTVYTKTELEVLSSFCKQHNLYLMLDGARLGSALTSPINNLTLAQVAQLTDILTIGGTKNGALLGEAIVITNPNIQQDFLYHIKQRGGLLSKGRILGSQFVALFKDGLYWTLAAHANTMAQKLANGISAAGHKFLSDPVSNQIFPILPKSVIKQLRTSFSFYDRKHFDDETVAVRLVTSWATQEDQIDKFLTILTKSSK